MLDGYKTYLSAVLAAVFGVLATTDWVAFSNDPKTGLSIVGMAVLMAVMRAITQATTVKKALDTVPPGLVVLPAATKAATAKKK